MKMTKSGYAVLFTAMAVWNFATVVKSVITQTSLGWIPVDLAFGVAMTLFAIQSWNKEQ